MSIFGSILSKIFGAASATPAAATQAASSAPAQAAPSGATAAGVTAGGAAAAGTATAGQPSVDVVAVLTEMASKNGQSLNWKSSIVDLMKLLGLDSSLDARKQLADELGYSGDANDSATMNVWLHKQVMVQLAENGGIVPDSLKV